MGKELRGLDAAELTRLGGLKTRCSAPLFCAEHTNPYPCDLCDIEGRKAVACTACHHEFPEGLESPGERRCASQAVFAESARIAFEAHALAALAAEASDKDAAEERHKRDKKVAERKARTERKRRERAERSGEEAIPKASESSAPGIPPSGEDKTGGDRIAGYSRWAAVVAALVGGYMQWQTPLLDLPYRSNSAALVFGLVLLVVCGAGSGALARKYASHATLPGWSPLVWAFMNFAWPGFAGLAAARVLGETGQGVGHLLTFIAFAIGMVTLAPMVISRGGIALTMSPPWPIAILPEGFKGLRSVSVWLGLAATLVVNLTVWTTPQALHQRIEAMLTRPDSKTSDTLKPNKPLLIQATPASRMPSPEKDARGFVRANLADIVAEINGQPSLSRRATPGTLPKVDKAVEALSQLPRPPVGNSDAARRLVQTAKLLAARDSDPQSVIDQLVLAHQADPRDAEILTQLAFARLKTGTATMALESAVESLRLDPKRTNAWIALAQIRLTTATGEAWAMQEAARYYVVAYWYSRHRPTTLRFLKDKNKIGSNDVPGEAIAAGIALQYITKTPAQSIQLHEETVN